MSDILKDIPEALTPIEEAYLTTRIAHTQGDDDINMLVLHNLREAVPYALTCCRCSLSEGEVLSLCYTALRKAAIRFKPGGVRFFAYAKQDVRGEIARYWKTLEVVRNAGEHESETNDINRIPIHCSNGQEGEGVIFEYEDGPIEPDYAEPEFDKIDLRERWKQIAPLLRSLDARERLVIMLHYESGLSREQIAKMLVPSVTRQTIDNIHDAALKKLRRLALAQ
jgi:RNA polymerase sigma factor (sigma-70 family)